MAALVDLSAIGKSARPDVQREAEELLAQVDVPYPDDPVAGTNLR